jgi:hypothetical protein
MTNPARGRVRRSLTILTVAMPLAAALCAFQPAMAGPAPPSAVVSTVTGTVREASSGRAVPGATVRLPATGLSTTTLPNGRFDMRDVRSGFPYRRVDVVVAARGFAAWTISGAPLYPGDTLILDVRLGSTRFADRVQTPQERAASAGAGSPDPPSSGTCSGWSYQQVPPSTIWVYRMQSGVSEQYDFEFYAEHVLPNEWISSWDADALAAGAIAVRTYAAWHELPGNSYSSGSNCADVRDTIDGVFDPTWTTASAELAVQAAWGSIVYQNGGLFVAHYFAGSSSDPCAAVTGQYAGWMAQWGTQTCAKAGMLFPDIVTTYYGASGNTIKWYYTNNLLLNPNVNSEAMYPWAANGNTSFARVKGSGDGDSWFIHADPTVQGRNAIVYQERSYDGAATTTYHAQVSLRCADGGASSCAVTVKVVTIPPQGGGGWIYRNSKVTVPNDGAWHQYAFDPAAAGVIHQAVRLSLVSTQPYDLDSAILTSPYGGP